MPHMNARLHSRYRNLCPTVDSSHVTYNRCFSLNIRTSVTIMSLM